MAVGQTGQSLHERPILVPLGFPPPSKREVGRAKADPQVSMDGENRSTRGSSACHHLTSSGGTAPPKGTFPSTTQPSTFPQEPYQVTLVRSHRRYTPLCSCSPLADLLSTSDATKYELVDQPYSLNTMKLHSGEGTSLYSVSDEKRTHDSPERPFCQPRASWVYFFFFF